MVVTRRRKWGDASFSVPSLSFSDRNNAHQIFLPAGLRRPVAVAGLAVPMWRRERRAVAVCGAGDGLLGLRLVASDH